MNTATQRQPAPRPTVADDIALVRLGGLDAATCAAVDRLRARLRATSLTWDHATRAAAAVSRWERGDDGACIALEAVENGAGREVAR